MFNMKKIILIFFTLAIHVSADLTFDPRVKAIIPKVMDQNYTAVYNRLTSLLSEEPDNLDALFMLLNTRQIEIMDYEAYELYGNSLVKTIDSVLYAFNPDTQTKCKNNKAKCLFYLGTLYGMKSLVLAKTDEWLQGISKARTSVKHLKKAQSMDPDMYEVLYGIGLFNYYLAQNFKWLPFMKGKSKQGLAEVESVAQSTSPINYMAKNSLGWIYVERNNYAKADQIVSPVLKEYPNNTIYLRIKTRIAFSTQNYENAVILAKKLITLSEERNPINWSDLLFGYEIKIGSLLALNKNIACRTEINKAMKYEIPKYAKKIVYVRNHLDYIHVKNTQIKN